jgi:hypothetical protein
MEKNDINLFQYGGCGAAYLFHQLLLTDDFDMCFKFGKSAEYSRDKNFRKDRIKSWKAEEVPPDNPATLLLETDKRRIFSVVNSLDLWHKYPGRKIVLYTDLRTQIRMTHWKKAFWFFERPTHDWQIEDSCRGFRQLVKDNPNNIFGKYIENNLFDYYTIKLQDILTVDGLAKVFEDLGTKITQKNIDFINYYLDAHPPKLLDKCGIKKIH